MGSLRIVSHDRHSTALSWANQEALYGERDLRDVSVFVISSFVVLL